MKTMLKAALAAALSLLVLSPAHAADNLIGKMNDTGGTAFSSRAYDIGPDSSGRRIYVPAHALLDPTGAPFLTSGNPGYFTLAGVLPLPTGAATAAAQATANGALATIATNTAGLATAVGQATGNTSTAAIAAAAGAPSDAAWNGSAASATQTSIFKALFSKLSGLLTVDTVVRATSVDRGAVLATAGTAQTLVPANPARRGLAVQNRAAPGSSYSAATSVFMSCQATATQDFHSLEVPAGALYETPGHHTGTGDCSFVSGTAATPVYIREF